MPENDVHVQFNIKMFRPLCTAPGKIRCLVLIFDLGTSHFSSEGDIGSLPISTMRMLPDLFSMFLPQRGHIYVDF